MPYPTTEQYMEALQFPSKHLKDAELANAKVESTGMGLPFARSGGFALTFKLIGPGKSWALRLFQKDRVGDKLGERYGAISRGIKTCGLPYFVEFSFLPAGISIQTQTYSCVKMGWAEGTVLGTYIEKNKRNKTVLLQLRQNIQKMAADMERVGFAHGDFQTDNLLVSPSGGLKFVDYDAFFVPEIASLGAIEVGYPNFQHPERGKLKPFDSKMDRFSYLVIDSALNALISNPDLWDKVSADPQGLLVRASDFASPHTSVSFHALALDPNVGTIYRRLAAICEGKYTDIPLLSDFLAGKGPAALNLKPISTITLSQSTKSSSGSAGSSYQTNASQVVSGDNFLAAKGAGGRFVEIVGFIKNVDTRPTKYGSPKVFLIFGTVSGNSVYVPIWAEGIANLNAAGKSVGAQSKGQWVSVTGMMDADFATGSWSRTGITVVDASQINFISEVEAKRRLTSKSISSSTTTTPSTPAQATALNSASRNAQIAAQARAAASKSSPSSNTYKKSPAPRKSPARKSTSSAYSSTPTYSARPKSFTSDWGCGTWIAIGIGVWIVLAIIGSIFNGG
ncbi:hypothetical protein MCEMKE157_01064 [actinobacterium SCGC AAA044-D11]